VRDTYPSLDREMKMGVFISRVTKLFELARVLGFGVLRALNTGFSLEVSATCADKLLKLLGGRSNPGQIWRHVVSKRVGEMCALFIYLRRPIFADLPL